MKEVRERFTTIRHRDYIELFENGKHICCCDNDQEVEEEKEIYKEKIYKTD